MLPAPSATAFRCAAASLWLLVAIACRATPAPTASPARGRDFPTLDDACTNDADCALLGDESADLPPATYACCPGCTERAVNGAWLARFRAACHAAPPPMCPPIGCPTPILRAVCDRGRCRAEAARR